MIALAFAASALMSNLFGGQPSPVSTTRYAEAGWRLEIRRDTFSDRTGCRLSADRMLYQQGAIGFATGSHRGLSDTWFRIDGASARRWREVYPDLLASNVAIETGGLDDPTGGVVWLPLDLVANARDVSIEFYTAKGARLRRFQLRGFAGMHAAALRLGCPPGAFAVGR
jgi:hypothetical protein